MANLKWPKVDAQVLSETFKIPLFRLIGDFYANGEAILLLKDSQLI